MSQSGKLEVTGGDVSKEELTGNQSPVIEPVGKSPEEAGRLVKKIFANWKPGDTKPTETIAANQMDRLPRAEHVQTVDGKDFLIREYPITSEEFAEQHSTTAHYVPEVKELETLNHAEIGYDGLWIHFDNGDTTPNPENFSAREYFETKLKPVLDRVKESDPDLYEILKKKQLNVQRFQTTTSFKLTIGEDGFHRGIQTFAIPTNDESSPSIVLTNNDSDCTIAHEMGHAVFPNLPLRELSEMTAIGLGKDYYAGDTIPDDAESDVNPKKVANRAVGNALAPVLAVLSDIHQPLPQTVEELVRVAIEVGHPLPSNIEPEYNYASGYFLAITEDGRDRNAAKRVALASVEVQKEIGSTTVASSEIMRKSIMKGLDMTEAEAIKVMERAAEIVMFRRQTLIGSSDAPLLGPAFDEQIQKNKLVDEQDAIDRARFI